MGHGSTKPSGDDSSRQARIRAIVDDALSRWEAGESIDSAALVSAHPDLMPDLAEALATARSIFLARRRGGPSADSNSGNDSGADYQEELQALQEHLPNYTLLSRLEHGGQGVVYQAIQLSTSRRVALKILLEGPLSSPKRRARFAREIEIVSLLKHPNIVTVYDSGEVKGRPYFAMEYVEGLPIDDYVLLHEPSAKSCVRLMITICRAINYAHQRGIIHRDLKPMNILVDLDDQPHILDFGLARLLDDEREEGLTLSQADQVIGTLHYLSPEQARGDSREADTLSDTYTLGLILYRLLTGTFPYDVDGNQAAVLKNITDVDPRPFRQATKLSGSASIITRTGATDDDLERITLKALSKDKERRYQSAGELADDLERYLAGEPVQAKAASTLYVLRKNLKRYKVQTAFASILLVVLIASSILVTFQWARATEERDNARAVANLAHEMFNAVVGEMEESIATLAGGTKVRDRLMSGIATKLEELQNLVRDDVSLEGLSRQVLEKQGDVAAALNRHKDAEKSYRSFLDRSILAADNMDSPPDERKNAHLAVVRAHRKLGSIPSPEQRSHLQASLVEIQKSTREQTGGDDALFEEASTLMAFAQFESKLGLHSRSLVLLNEIEKLGIPEHEEQLTELRWGSLVAEYWSLRGRTLADLSQGAESISMLRKAVAIRQQLCATNLTNAILRYQLWQSQIILAERYRAEYLTDDTIAVLKQAVATGEYLCSVEPELLEWKAALFLNNCELANAYSDLKEHPNRAPYLEAARRIAEEMNRLNPQNPLARECLGRSHTMRGTYLGEMGDWASALVELQNAMRIRQAMAFEEQSPSAWLNLIRTIGTIGQAQRQLKMTADALCTYQIQYQMISELARKHPDSTEIQSTYFIAISKLAAWELDPQSEVGDHRAGRILDQAEAELLEAEQRGVFANEQRWMSEYRGMLRDNRGDIARRDARRAKARTATSAPASASR